MSTLDESTLGPCYGVVVITTAQLHLTKCELKFCTCENPARDVWEACTGEEPLTIVLAGSKP